MNGWASSLRVPPVRVFRCDPVLVLIGFIFLLFCVLAGAAGAADDSKVSDTSPLPTGVRLDAVGDAIELGSVPLGMAVAPGGDKVAVVLSGWREQGLQIVDLKSRRVTQTLEQNAAFLGVVFSRDGRELYVSGGNDDSIFCYSWENGAAKFARKIVLGQQKADKTGSRYPAGLAVSLRGNYLYVAENVGDDVAVVDLKKKRVVERLATDHYPYAVEVASDGRVYVSAWGADTVSIFKERGDGKLSGVGKVKVGRHSSALVANASGTQLYVALAGSDQIAVVDTGGGKVLRYLSDSNPEGPAEGSTPNALALSKDGSKLFVAEADNNAVAVFDISEIPEKPSGESGRAAARLEGRIPTDWYPTAVVESDGELLVLSGKGHGSHANRDGPIPGEGIKRRMGYDLGQLNGSLRVCPKATLSHLAEYSRRVAEANRWDEPRSRRTYPPFKHVIYIIKENRTYDQVFGDLKEGDGDAGLVFFGEKISPNHHSLALRFGLFDRFFTNAEVSSQGHIWSTAAYVTDYGEKTVHSAYSDRRADIDDEEIDEPGNGFLWNLAKKKGIIFRDYGEMVNNPKGGGWASTQRRGLAGNINLAYPPFNLAVSDQVRADVWLAEFRQFVEKKEMPQFEILHLPSDHTAGGKAGFRTPRAMMADNDLALGRIVEALSKSQFWRDTVIFVLEDDSQNGPDHVDSHRSPFLVISAYNRPGTIHRFANTTDVVAAIEDVLGLDRLSKYDYFSRSLADVFSETPDFSPWTAEASQVDLKEMNAPRSAGARMSEGLDFSAADRVDDARFNRILWRIVKGDEAFPPMRTAAPVHALEMSW
jgi:DNA-binding beta-propeller fold protein YncE